MELLKRYWFFWGLMFVYLLVAGLNKYLPRTVEMNYTRDSLMVLLVVLTTGALAQIIMMISNDWKSRND